MGGAIALVANGDQITIDIPRRDLTLEVSDAELATRRDQVLARARLPAADGSRPVSAALQAYAAMTTSAATGAARDVGQLATGALAGPPGLEGR